MPSKFPSIVPVESEEPQGEISLGVLDTLIGFRIRRIQNHLSRTFNARLDRAEVRPGAFSALALIAANPGLSQKTLAREAGFDKATIVGILDNMEQQGWTMRQKSRTDRRRHLLFVTAEGQEALSRMRILADTNEQAIQDALSASDRQKLQTLLDKLYKHCFVDLGD